MELERRPRSSRRYSKNPGTCAAKGSAHELLVRWYSDFDMARLKKCRTVPRAKLRSRRRASAGRSVRRADTQSTTNASMSASACSIWLTLRASANFANSVKMGPRPRMLRVEEPCRYPVDDERVDERFRLFDLVDIAGFRELRELRQDGDPPKDAAGRVALLAQDRHVKLDLRSEPAAHDPVDRLRLEKEALQHGNLHSKVRKLRVRFLLSSCDVPPPSPGAKKITKLLLHRHITEAGTKPRLCSWAHNRGSPSSGSRRYRRRRGHGHRASPRDLGSSSLRRRSGPSRASRQRKPAPGGRHPCRCCSASCRRNRLRTPRRRDAAGASSAAGSVAARHRNARRTGCSGSPPDAGSDILATAGAVSRRGHAAPSRPPPKPATDDPNGACQRPRTGVGRAPPRSAPPRPPSSARPPRRGRDIPSRSSARSARCATPLCRSAPAPL